MNQNANFQKVKFLLGISVISAIIILAGCTPFQSDSDDFGSKYLPNKKYFVGGGLEIEWIAPQPGTAYLVEEKTGRIVITRSLDEEDEFEFSPDEIEEKESRKIFGLSPNELQFSLYFIPTTKY